MSSIRQIMLAEGLKRLVFHWNSESVLNDNEEDGEWEIKILDFNNWRDNEMVGLLAHEFIIDRDLPDFFFNLFDKHIITPDHASELYAQWKVLTTEGQDFLISFSMPRRS